MVKKLSEVFKSNKVLIGMIHLAGNDSESKIYQALNEIETLQKAGFEGVIIEDYHGSREDVYRCVEESSKMGFEIIRGINLLSNPYASFSLANSYGADFVQFDSVLSNRLDVQKYGLQRAKYPEILVLGGVRFKYTPPTGKSLDEDLTEAISRAEVIVTTGEGTGIETPLQKLNDFRSLLGDCPLFVGAGVNKFNVLEQLKVCNGAIVGSSLKPYGDTREKIDFLKAKELRDLVQ